MRILTLLGGHAATAVLLLARNLLVARLIPTADYGIAATFAVAMALVEMASQFGMQAQIVRAAEGDDPDYLAAVHGFQITRGLLSATVLFLGAGLIAGALGVPDLAWAYRVMAAAPLLRALQNFDIHRQTRSMRFGPVLLTGFVPAAISLAAVVPLAMVLDDWRVMLVALLLQEVCACAASHKLAGQRYRVRFDLSVARQSVRFGWPILLQGIVLFAVFQGDKILVARSLGLEALGVFAMGVTLSLAPTLILIRTLQGWFLPQLSKAWGGPDFGPAAMAAVQAGMLAALALAGALIAAGPSLVALALGPGFQGLTVLLPWMVLQQALRVCRAGAVTCALAGGISWLGAATDGVRALCLPAAWLVLRFDGALLEVVLVAVCAEFAGTALALSIGARLFRLPPMALLGIGLVAGVSLAVLPLAALHQGSAGALAVATVSCGALFALAGDLRRSLALRPRRLRTFFAIR